MARQLLHTAAQRRLFAGAPLVPAGAPVPAKPVTPYNPLFPVVGTPINADLTCCAIVRVSKGTIATAMNDLNLTAQFRHRPLITRCWSASNTTTKAPT